MRTGHEIWHFCELSQILPLVGIAGPPVRCPDDLETMPDPSCKVYPQTMRAVCRAEHEFIFSIIDI